MAPTIPGKPEEVVMTHSIGFIKPHHHCSQQHALELSLRTNPSNPNHHLWDNHGTWYITYTVCEPGCSGVRRRESLGTRNVVDARGIRDELFARLERGVL
ncbi:MAG: hypothetical protein HN341_02520 [Verrucomicrobia bacterium]|nr:hypothetical protein [Verrucomicrobiota bacterium]